MAYGTFEIRYDDLISNPAETCDFRIAPGTKNYTTGNKYDVYYQKQGESGWTRIDDSGTFFMLGRDNNQYDAPKYVKLKGMGNFDGGTTQNCDGIISVSQAHGYFNITGDFESLVEGEGSGTPLSSFRIPIRAFAGIFYECTGLRNITSMTFPSGTLPDGCFSNTFYKCANLVNADINLPATTLGANCYRSMFYECTNMETGPNYISATTLGSYSCYTMFSGCTKYSGPTSFPATTLGSYSCYGMFSSSGALFPSDFAPTTVAEHCCYYMFGRCTSITSITGSLPATTLADNCYASMFSECTSLLTVPTNFLPATTLAQYCYYGMFSNCSQLSTAPNLPAATMTFHCYNMMFSGCTSLVTAPTLIINSMPAYTSQSCLYNMFYNCTSLTTVPNNSRINANIIPNMGLQGTFYNCSNLINIPRDFFIGVNRVDYYGLKQTFMNCTSLTIAPNILATNIALGNECFMQMFDGCTNLITGPELASEMPLFVQIESQSGSMSNYWNGSGATNGYKYMFRNCINMETGPSTLAVIYGAGSIYEGMFYNCSKLEKGPDILLSFQIPTAGCRQMFYGCSSLKNTPVSIPAMPRRGGRWYIYPPNSGYRSGNYNVLDQGCEQMYYNCTSLTTLPLLPSNILYSNCYNQMFYGCTNIKISATKTDEYNMPYRLPTIDDINTTTYLSNNIAGNMFSNTGGTFTGTPAFNTTYYLPASYISITSWNTQTRSGSDTAYSSRIIKLTPNSTKIYVKIPYSDDLNTWTDIDTLPKEAGTVTIELTPNQELQLKGINNSNKSEILNITSDSYSPSTAATFECRGSLENLIESDGSTTPIIISECFKGLFEGCQNIYSARDLLLPNITNAVYNCYENMFKDCDHLNLIPILTENTLAPYCYKYMFMNCVAVTGAPALKSSYSVPEGCYEGMFYNTRISTMPTLDAMNLSKNCFKNMFTNCTSLKNISTLPATTLNESCYEEMFLGCTNLVTLPTISATTLAKACCKNMFKNCSKATTTLALLATTLTESCYEGMFYGCTALTTTVNLSSVTAVNKKSCKDMFYGCVKIATPTNLSALALADNCYDSMYYGCTALKISDVKTSQYQLPYRIPTTGTGVNATQSTYQMFTNTGGRWSGTPDINKIYYLYGRLPSSYNLYIGVNGQSKKVDKIYIGVNNKAKEVNAVYIGVNNKAKRC